MDSFSEEHPYLFVIIASVIIGLVLLWNETTKYRSTEKKEAVVKEQTGSTIILIIGMIIFGLIGAFISNALK